MLTPTVIESAAALEPVTSDPFIEGPEPPFRPVQPAAPVPYVPTSALEESR